MTRRGKKQTRYARRKQAALKRLQDKRRSVRLKLANFKKSIEHLPVKVQKRLIKRLELELKRDMADMSQIARETIWHDDRSFGKNLLYKGIRTGTLGIANKGSYTIHNVLTHASDLDDKVEDFTNTWGMLSRRQGRKAGKAVEKWTRAKLQPAKRKIREKGHRQSELIGDQLNIRALEMVGPKLRKFKYA